MTELQLARNLATANRIEEARENFANYTQRVAFNITLSRDMIGMLHLVRDWGAPHMKNWIERKDGDAAFRAIYPRISSHFVPQVQSLIRRGLVYHDYIEPSDAPEGHRYYKLTRAGELMCEMLIEVGLLTAIEANRKKA